VKTRAFLLVVCVLALLLPSGCAEANLAQDNASLCNRGLSGFVRGLWHGFIAPISFIGSLFDTNIAIYDVCNVGGWYDFGYCLGIGAFTGGSHSAASVAQSDSSGDDA
jgi:hypothetical protein